jgi:hypothetical protein
MIECGSRQNCGVALGGAVFLLRAVFWVVLVSFALTGGDFERASNARGFAAPARHAAAQVVETVAGLRTICEDHERLCEGTRATIEGVRHWGESSVGHAQDIWKWTGKQFQRIVGHH